MKELVLIVFGILGSLLIFQAYLDISSSLYMSKLEQYQSNAPIYVYFENNTLYLFNPHAYYIYNISSHVAFKRVESNLTQITISWQDCPLALRIYTNKGLYKVYYIKCK